MRILENWFTLLRLSYKTLITCALSTNREREGGEHGHGVYLTLFQYQHKSSADRGRSFPRSIDFESFDTYILVICWVFRRKWLKNFSVIIYSGNFFACVHTFFSSFFTCFTWDFLLELTPLKISAFRCIMTIIVAKYLANRKFFLFAFFFFVVSTTTVERALMRECRKHRRLLNFVQNEFIKSKAGVMLQSHKNIVSEPPLFFWRFLGVNL